MARMTTLAILVLAGFSSAALATPEPATKAATPPPPASSHAPAQPDTKAAATKPDAKTAEKDAKPDAKTAGMSAWRKAYVAKHGHEPGVAAKKAAAKPLPKYKRCT